MAYATLAELKAMLGITDAQDDSRLQEALDAAEEIVDGWCHRSFGQVASQARTFTATTSTRLDTDDLVSVTSVKVDRDGDGTYEETVAASAYALRPANAAASGRPYTQLVLLTTAGLVWPDIENGVEVTGTWGWPSVPSAVKSATLRQAAALWRSGSQAPWGVADPSLAGDDIRVNSRFLDRQAQLLLSPYRKVLIG